MGPGKQQSWTTGQNALEQRTRGQGTLSWPGVHTPQAHPALHLRIPGPCLSSSCPWDLSPTGWSVFIAEIIRKVVSPPPWCQPLVSPDRGPPECIQLMKQCWEEAPEDRPNLDQIYSQVSAPRGAGCSQETANQFTSLCPVGTPHAGVLEILCIEGAMGQHHHP